jgi:hypothetical protein
MKYHNRIQSIYVHKENGGVICSYDEYPEFSVGESFSPDTAGHMALIPVWTAASPGGSQSEPLFTRAFYIDKGGQPGSYCL